MTGFRADADPALFADAKITGAYILDPWYPDVSSIWGPSDPPGTFQNEAEMIRNYLKWKRPEGKYPERDGLYIAVVPTRQAGADPDPPDPAGEEDREQHVLGDHPGRVPERDGEDAWPRRAPAWRATTTASPANEATTWRSVSCVAYRPRDSGYASASNGTDSANAATTADVGATSSAPNLPPPSRTSTSVPDRTNSSRRSGRGQHRDGRRGSGRGPTGTPRPSSSANAADSTGKTASENDTPMRLTGRTW